MFHRKFLTGSLALFPSGFLLARNSFLSKLPLCVRLSAILRTLNACVILIAREDMRIVQVVRALSTRLCVFFCTCMFVLAWAASGPLGGCFLAKEKQRLSSQMGCVRANKKEPLR